jgi:hypothetical protein
MAPNKDCGFLRLFSGPFQLPSDNCLSVADPPCRCSPNKWFNRLLTGVTWTMLFNIMVRRSKPLLRYHLLSTEAALVSNHIGHESKIQIPYL